jgi:hypothetical protein
MTVALALLLAMTGVGVVALVSRHRASQRTDIDSFARARAALARLTTRGA